MNPPPPSGSTRAAPATSASRRYGPQEHGISQASINSDARQVVHTLREAGFEAYIVGGCVRDLLLGREPKDFDVSTSAHPEEVHRLFRRSRIVGRRFQIVHVRAGREIIEVSTFRGHHSPGFDSDPELESEAGDEDEAPAAVRPQQDSAVCATSGMLLRDNVFGTVEEDALRRDFTVNGLYYDPDSGVVLDFSTGVEDLAARQLRVIGNPVVRFQEDPVRMLRALRFAAKLGFTIDPFAVAAIARCRELLTRVPAARMFDEVLKLLLTGQGQSGFLYAEQHRVFELLFPDTMKALRREPAQRELVIRALRNSDERIAQGKAVTPAFLYAALLWPPLVARLRTLLAEGMPEVAALHRAAPEVIGAQVQHTTIPRRFATPMREIWELQHRLVQRRSPQKLSAHPRFRAAYDFLLLREQAGEALQQAGDWWTQFQAGEAPPPPPPEREIRRRRRRRPRGARSDGD